MTLLLTHGTLHHPNCKEIFSEKILNFVKEVCPNYKCSVTSLLNNVKKTALFWKGGIPKGEGSLGLLNFQKCVFLALKYDFSAKKTIKIQIFSIDDTRYWGFDTPYFLILWEGLRSRLSMYTQYDILKAGWQSSTLSWWQNDKDILTEYLPLSLCCLLPDMTSGCCPLSGDSLWSSLPWAWLSLHCCPPC